MRKHKIIGFILALSLALSVVSVVRGAGPFCAYNLQPIKIMSASENGRVVGVLKSNSAIKVIQERNSKYGFDYYGQTCWVAKRNTLRGRKLKDYVLQHPNLFTKKATIQKKCKIYRLANSKTKVLSKAVKGDQYLVTSVFGDWVKVSFDGKSGYIKRSSVRTVYTVGFTNFTKLVLSSSKRDNIVNYALKFVGNPYVWGGNRLVSGVDCSGFTKGVLEMYGVNLPRQSSAQARVGKSVSVNNLKKGDLLFYKHGDEIGHVSMYIGNGKMVHAKGRAYGIVIEDVNYSKIAWARNVID